MKRTLVQRSLPTTTSKVPWSFQAEIEAKYSRRCQKFVAIYGSRIIYETSPQIRGSSVPHIQRIFSKQCKNDDSDSRSHVRWNIFHKAVREGWCKRWFPGKENRWSYEVWWYSFDFIQRLSRICVYKGSNHLPFSPLSYSHPKSKTFTFTNQFDPTSFRHIPKLAFQLIIPTRSIKNVFPNRVLSPLTACILHGAGQPHACSGEAFDPLQTRSIHHYSLVGLRRFHFPSKGFDLFLAPCPTPLPLTLLFPILFAREKTNS